MYLPYAPIARDLGAGLHNLYLDLALGLAALYALLFAITVSASRGLRRELSINAFMAHHDSLTELPNRALFLTLARAAVARVSPQGRPVAVGIIDLEHSKDINDTLGHQSGDLLSPSWPGASAPTCARGHRRAAGRPATCRGCRSTSSRSTAAL
jgi:hypothetical protein